MYCWSCGKEIDDNSKFCPECGASSVREKTETDNSSKPKKKNGKQKKGLIIGLSIIALAVTALLVYFFFGSNAEAKKSIMPYGVQWGDSPDIVMRKDKNAVKGGTNEKGEQLYRNETIDGSFFNLSKDATESPFILYRFMGNKLCAITISCPINTSAISSNDYIDGIVVGRTFESSHGCQKGSRKRLLFFIAFSA